MSRPYAGAATTHMVLGLICMAAGITWICMLFFYEPLFATINQELKPIPEILPAWVTVLLAAKIYCGFWVSDCYLYIPLPALFHPGLWWSMFQR